MKTLVKTIAAITLTIGLTGTSAFANGGRGDSFSYGNPSVSDASPMLKTTPVSMGHQMHKFQKFSSHKG